MESRRELIVPEHSIAVKKVSRCRSTIPMTGAAEIPFRRL
jgi:hypothetical protein